MNWPVNKLKFLFCTFGPVCTAILLLYACSSGRTPTKTETINYVSEYEANSPIKITHTAAFDGTSYWVYLSVNVRRLRKENSPENFYNNLNLSYKLRQTYEGPDLVTSDSIPGLTVTPGKDVFVCNFKINKSPSFGPYLFVSVTDKKTGYVAFEDIALETEGQSNFWSNILYNISDSTPVFGSFLNNEDEFKFAQGGNRQDLYVNYIKNDFPPSTPPMSTTARSVRKDLKIDSIYRISINTPFKFDSAGLYLIQEDTTKEDGLGFRVEMGKYPKYTKIESLIKPLIYISTTDETRAITKSAEPKKALDAYWLKLGGNANDAKKLIKSFYDRVEVANEKFTSYKEGWKTDRGMIYIVFGVPDYVYHGADQEQWVYDKTETMSQVKFTFARIPNIYSNNHYELIRYPEYEDYWYNKVDLWRKGTPGI